MADILIRGMEMPRRREEVFLFAVDSDGKVYGWDSEELPRLKAIAIPDHGRLIDADALAESIKDSLDECHKWANQAVGTFAECSLRVKNAPTIIPASDGGK